MSYIGNTPAENYASFLTETFSVSATVNYTLSHAVSNENDIRLVINGVVQQPGSGKAYTASNTTLTLTSATQSGDSMYAVYLGRALQTVNPPNASVGSSQTAPTIITGQTAETSIATDDTILIHDTSASALRKMTRANFVSGIGGANTPSFLAKSASGQSISNNTHTQIVFGTEVIDTDGAFASNVFTVPSGKAGKYFLYAQAGRQSWGSNRFLIQIQKTPSGGSAADLSASESAIGESQFHTTNTLVIADLSVGDAIKVNIFHNNGSSQDISTGDRTVFMGYKLI